MDELQDYKFNEIYDLAALIDSSAKYESSFFNYDRNLFINRASKFSKKTLLHLYITSTSLNHFRTQFRKESDFFYEDGVMDSWYNSFGEYNINLSRFNFEGKQTIYEWFNKNEKKFEQLFDKMADELFYILFSNRGFLLNFNYLVSETVCDNIFPEKNLNPKGKIKRVSIPQWVKNAVYHRDKGRCVFCNTDLTRLINILTSSNFDHIIPLDLNGANDPCNIQLSCEKCNKSKKNNDGSTSTKYIPWW